MRLRASARAHAERPVRTPRQGRSPGRHRLPAWSRWLPFAVLLAPLLAHAVVRGDGLSHISNGDSASEYWDIVAHFDSNHQLFARFLITNEGPGDRTAIATWQLIDPSGKRTEFRNGRRAQRWTLSPEGDRMEIGSSIFDQSGPTHRLEYDSTKRGIRVELQFSPRGPVAWTDSASDGYPIDLLELATPLTGTIWLKGMGEPTPVTGTITIAHIWMEESEADLALRRIEFSSTGSGPSVYLSDRTAPSGDRERWLVVARDGDLLFETSDFQLTLSDPPSGYSGDYPTPSAQQISSPEIEGAIQNGSTLVEIDPLEAIPQPFRFLLSFKLRPHRVWARASFEVKLLAGQDTPGTVLKGSGVSTITFTNPLPQKATQPGI